MRNLQAFFVQASAIGGLCAAVVASAPGLIKAAPEAGGWAPLIGGYNRTGQRLFQMLAREPGNIVLSPYSVGTAMAMALVGARGETAREMAQALNLELPRDETDAANAAVLSSLDRAAAKALELRVANGLMLAQQGDRIAGDYVALLRRDYAAEVFHGSDVATVNAWVRKKTDGKIDSILNRLDPMAAMVLVNAIYFKAPWQNAFDPKATRAETFRLRDGETKVPMMHMEDAFQLARRPGYRAIRLPYTGKRLSMVVVLPDGGTAETVRRLDGEEMRHLLEVLHTQAQGVDLSLPRFKASYEANLGEPFREMGMRRAFDLGTADFSGMTGKPRSEVPLAITQIKHRAVIDVAEQGTTAAAATGTELATSALRPRPEPFRVDRPFLFVIVDDETGAILFEGRIDDPRQAS